MEPGLPEEYQHEDALADLRDEHKSLICGGLQALSRGYMDSFVDDVRGAGVPATALEAEGRNYARILQLAGERGVDLIALGAHGLGALEDGLLGSTATRVLRKAQCDVLIGRRLPRGGGVLAGIDGSRHAEEAARKAEFWSRALDGPLTLGAAYDPSFHVQVFEAMARSLSDARQQEVGLSKQEELHADLIDEGLGTLYQGFLDRATRAARDRGNEAEEVLLRGKAYRAIVDQASRSEADLIVVGRYGHHRHDGALLGSNAEALVRTAAANVLVTAPAPGADEGSSASAERADMPWDEEAVARLERVPSFARPVARRAVEAHVRERGGSRVSLEDFRQVARSMGMGDARSEDEKENGNG